MIDHNKAFLAFKQVFDNMSYEEREQYLKKMGFSFGEDPSGKLFRAKKLRCSRPVGKRNLYAAKRTSIKKATAEKQSEAY